ncbi:MAG TPA: anthrone oxygenase family protein [Pyrinomonadaceae bacterium]|nr:anthrone oxygenase family protein [Pyrinomonadaceae bacterium]
MKAFRLSTSALMLAVVFWGTLLGGIAYSHLVFFPVYLSDLPASAVVVNGPYGLSDQTFWFFIHPLLIISLIAAIVLNWNSRSRRNLIALSCAVYVAVLVITMLYFVPELVLFKNSPQSTLQAAEWLARGKRWQRLSWLRGFIMYMSFVPLLFALTKPAHDSRDLVP